MDLTNYIVATKPTIIQSDFYNNLRDTDKIYIENNVDFSLGDPILMISTKNIFYIILHDDIDFYIYCKNLKYDISSIFINNKRFSGIHDNYCEVKNFRFMDDSFTIKTDMIKAKVSIDDILNFQNYIMGLKNQSMKNYFKQQFK